MASRFNPTTGIPDLTGRVAIVTGANSGLGYLTALQLVNHGAKVYITTRSESKALDTIKRMEAENPALIDSGRLHWLLLDLSTVKAAKVAAEEFMSRESRLDILINNAAQLASIFTVTSEGLSDVFASDHVSPFVFTITLLPLLEQTAKLPGADVRVITMQVASAAHFRAPPATKFETIDDFRETCGSEASVNTFITKMARFGHAEVARILFAKELQRRWDIAGIPALSISLHPGEVATEGAERLVRKFGGLAAGLIWLLAGVLMMTPQQGAITQLFAATSPDVRKEADKYKGQYLVPYGRVAQPSEVARKPELPGQLWALTERVVQEILDKGNV